MKFVTPPENQGQIVTVSYACAAEYIYRRTYDASDRTESFDRAKIRSKDWVWYEEWDPVNGAPPKMTWKPCEEPKNEE